jgi:hypothetical protein
MSFLLIITKVIVELMAKVLNFKYILIINEKKKYELYR